MLPFFMFEDFLIQDDKVVQVRASSDNTLKKNAADRRELALTWLRQNPEIRPVATLDTTIQFEIIKKYGPEMDPIRVGKMTAAEYRKYKRIIASEYPALCIKPSQRYHHGN
ncbi:hypothetical protein MO867_12695 [Microbulbifer sp. OS29]|uniref:Uncharacterized protein n=1 Tax=Microbulbifer okhotskensis TaxID=2926617 RepID=A0A9X2J857_9GAMM|nr:hypothetical protein [Microbulbifer okhotskensis]MCO1335191.1 hypothetical protein [Microbulbifer okhotskensis]